MWAPRGSSRRPGRGRQDATSMGLLILLAQQAARLPNKPPVTLLLAAVQVLLYLEPGDISFLVPKLSAACIQPRRILESACFSLATGSTLKSATCLQLREWHRLLWSAFLHADETHLYYNMSSFLWKGAQLEPQMGSGGYLVMMTQLLALSQGWMVALAYFSKYWPLLQNMYFSQCTVGFSGVLFAMKVVLNHNSPGWSSVGGVPLPTKYVTWAELVYIQFIAPQASFLGHLSGILAGLTYVTVNHNDLNVFRAVRRLFYMGPRPFSGDGQNASTRTRNTQPDARAAAAAAAVRRHAAGATRFRQ